MEREAYSSFSATSSDMPRTEVTFGAYSMPSKNAVLLFRNTWNAFQFNPTIRPKRRAATSKKVPINLSSLIFIGTFLLVAALLRSEEHTSELQSRGHLVCRLLLEKQNI